jgi:hypothetical protein
MDVKSRHNECREKVKCWSTNVHEGSTALERR